MMLEQTTFVTAPLVTHLVFRLQKRPQDALEGGNKQFLKKRWQWKNSLYTVEFTKFHIPQNKVITFK